jgi:hypothetical protein
MKSDWRRSAKGDENGSALWLRQNRVFRIRKFTVKSFKKLVPVRIILENFLWAGIKLQG